MSAVAFAAALTLAPVAADLACLANAFSIDAAALAGFNISVAKSIAVAVSILPCSRVIIMLAAVTTLFNQLGIVPIAVAGNTLPPLAPARA